MKYQGQNRTKRPSPGADNSRKVHAAAIFKPWSKKALDVCPVQKDRLAAPALHALSRKGLWGLLIFLFVSIAAFMVQGFNPYHSLPEPVLQVLGCPPPAILIHLALVAYSFTVIVPVLIRMATAEPPVVGWQHLFCRAAFYFFYLVSTTLPANFVAVISIGIFLYAVEQAGIWVYLYKSLHGVEVSD